MKKSDVISILITFVMGFFAGTYLYLTGFAAIETEIALPDTKEVSQLAIVGDVYGGCQNTCPSFQVLYDGSYRYLYTPASGADKVLRQGKIPYELHKKLSSVITEAELIRQSKMIEPATCNSYEDGNDVVYKITLNGREYSIDSCGTAADTQSELWFTLREVWNYYETI